MSDDIKKSLQILAEAAQPKAPGAHVKGKEKASKYSSKKGHPFKGRLVGGESVGEALGGDTNADIINEMHMLIENFEESISALDVDRETESQLFEALYQLDVLVQNLGDE